MALEVTDANFDDTIRSGVILVDFWAPWCGPCLMQGPVVDKLAQQYDGRATVAKLNVDDNPDTPAKFGVMGIPTLILFKDGGKVHQFVGVQSEDNLKAALDGQL